jgi:hypothetical protein
VVATIAFMNTAYPNSVTSSLIDRRRPLTSVFLQMDAPSILLFLRIGFMMTGGGRPASNIELFAYSTMIYREMIADTYMQRSVSLSAGQDFPEK